MSELGGDAMRRVWLALVLVSILFGTNCGCCPRVVQCDKCGEGGGMINGPLPDQKCPCGGRIHSVRKLSHADWAEARLRGYVTLEDGEPVERD